MNVHLGLPHLHINFHDQIHLTLAVTKKTNFLTIINVQMQPKFIFFVTASVHSWFFSEFFEDLFSLIVRWFHQFRDCTRYVSRLRRHRPPVAGWCTHALPMCLYEFLSPDPGLSRSATLTCCRDVPLLASHWPSGCCIAPRRPSGATPHGSWKRGDIESWKRERP